MSQIQSPFTKKCPHCGKSIDTRRLRRIPFSGSLRWYQFTPGSQTACPECGGLVKSTAANSPILLVGFGALIFIALAYALFPVVRGWVALIPGAPFSLAPLALLVGWFALKNSVLLPAK
jgi:endogenous inhibitor of DNA gyrase (YacG/DUF329 family)